MRALPLCTLLPASRTHLLLREEQVVMCLFRNSAALNALKDLER
jgi:hypothetical protein